MKKTILLIVLSVVTLTTQAQSLAGRVYNESQEAMPFVNIYSQQNTKHTHSNDDGSFSLDGIKKGDTIILSHIGYTTKTIIITNLSKQLVVTLNKKNLELKSVVIEKKMDALNLFSDINLQTAPVQNAQEVFLKVPGLVIGQHAGGGKAEQIFLRGFDIDHGTDVAISVENMPVNMVSHAHGQGYADMHFIIPETIEKINFGKGPYAADKGNFATAGSVDLQLKKSLKENSVKIEGGQFNTKRLVGLMNLLNKEKQQAYLATEFNTTDGPFESSQNFYRYNFMGRYHAQINDANDLTISASHFTSQWDASGQIPERAVQSGAISRFGAIDDTEGGQTSRSNIWLQHTKLLKRKDYIKSNLYFSNYNFELFSNFTFFLNDSINGDQIRQFENRNVFGGQIEYGKELLVLNKEVLIKTGLSYRNDDIDNNELSHTKNRKTTLEQYQYGDVNETNIAAYASAEIELGNFLIQPGLRLDQFDFKYQDKLAATYSRPSQTSAVVSPKFNILYNYNKKLQFYLKAGKGFHSNDSRTVLNNSIQQNVPAALGTDLGFIWKARKNLFINLAAWQLYLEQEFVYVGDEGIVEPSGETTRKGLDLSVRYQPTKWLFINGDLNYAHARSMNTPEGESFIPLAPNLTAIANAQFIHPSGFVGGIRVRHMGDRAANEKKSIIAKGYTVTDANIGYNYRMFSLGIKVQNLFNIDWNETQFATTSRLQNENTPVEEIHFTPGTPFNFSAYLKVSF